MKMLIVMMALFSVVAQANTITNETKTVTLKNLSDFTGTCEPGISSLNEFSTFSGLDIYNLAGIFPLANTESVRMMDPKHRIGDNCTALLAEVNSQLPANLVLNRTVVKSMKSINRECALVLTESLTATVGANKFVGDSFFVVKKLPSAQCKP